MTKVFVDNDESFRHHSPQLTMTRRVYLTASSFVVMLVAIRAAAGFAQTGAPGTAFDVASVKINRSGNAETGWVPEPGRFTATNVTLAMLISTAFGAPQQPLANFQMSGGPSWIDTARFDIAATSPGATPVQMIPMLKRLIETRFALRTHLETRQMPVYTLVLARKGVPGPKMKPSPLDCAALAAGPPDRRCGSGQIFPGTLVARGASLAQIVSGLTRIMPGISRMVIDRTGLTGIFDIELTWRPEPMPALAAGPGSQVRASPPIDPGAPDLFTALQEQWGVKLEPGTGPVPVLIIDSAAMPTED